MSATHFTVVCHVQGTHEWREWRHKGIGASDAPTIMGENPFKSVDDLLNEKRGPTRDFTPNAAMARGILLEPEARRLYVERTGKSVAAACLQSTRFEWLRASLDGICFDQGSVVEIKCGKSAYRSTYQTRKVPSVYYGQMQHILAVTGYESLDYWCYWIGCTPIHIPVPRNENYIGRMLERELTFWNLVQRSE